ncbi:hypothetical protein AYI70_g1617 [Smittium culicis]|uniref:Uncharacterized protein n=1 Tax=Smittium culicis TaxID=133412 RepID=A0A1R1YBY3_9FUNG|nr:hypothetical protein AYI70_g1617 [Smittium culicis]
MSQDQVKELTYMVNELLHGKERNAEPEDSYFATKDFFRTPLTEEESKEAIHSCSRSSSMNYQLPPLNYSASSEVKKAEACLHGVQKSLNQATRPIGYYFHLRVMQDPRITDDDPHILFANTMRFFLSDNAATVIQGHLDNLYKGMELPGKSFQLVEPGNKPLMDQDKLEVLIFSKKPEK